MQQRAGRLAILSEVNAISAAVESRRDPGCEWRRHRTVRHDIDARDGTDG